MHRLKVPGQKGGIGPSKDGLDQNKTQTQQGKPYNPTSGIWNSWRHRLGPEGYQVEVCRSNAIAYRNHGLSLGLASLVTTALPSYHL